MSGFLFVPVACGGLGRKLLHNRLLVSQRRPSTWLLGPSGRVFLCPDTAGPARPRGATAEGPLLRRFFLCKRLVSAVCGAVCGADDSLLLLHASQRACAAEIFSGESKASRPSAQTWPPPPVLSPPDRLWRGDRLECPTTCPSFGAAAPLVFCPCDVYVFVRSLGTGLQGARSVPRRDSEAPSRCSPLITKLRKTLRSGNQVRTAEK